MIDIRRIGVFHHGTRDTAMPGKGSAVSILREKIQEMGDLSDALIILPEAFNIDGPYYGTNSDSCKPEHDPKMKWVLQELSGSLKAAFVVGMMQGAQPDANNLNPDRYSCAFLIDRSTEYLLALKSFDDGVGCQAAVAHFQPILHRGLNISCLICVDSLGTQKTNNREYLKILKALAPPKTGISVLCVPSHLTDAQTNSELVAECWKAHFDVVAVANSSSYCSSLIVCDDCKYTATIDSSENWIMTTPLPRQH